MDALVSVKIWGDNGKSGLHENAINTVINLNYMTRVESTGEVSFDVYFTDGDKVRIHGNYKEFIAIVKKLGPLFSFEKL